MATELLSILPADICREIDQYIYGQWIVDNLPTWQKEHRGRYFNVLKRLIPKVYCVRCRTVVNMKGVKYNRRKTTHNFILATGRCNCCDGRVSLFVRLESKPKQHRVIQKNY